MYLFWHVVYWNCLASPTPSRIYLSPPWAAGDNTSCSTSFVCSLLALLGLTHTLKDLPLPPVGSKEWCVTQYPFCMWSFGHIGSNLIHTLKDLPVSCKVGASNLTFRHEDGIITHLKDRVITHHKDVVARTLSQGQTHINSSQVKCFQIHSLLPCSFIRYFNNQISTTFSKSSKLFLVKNNLHQFPKWYNLRQKNF